jgi:hypothetical protein
MRNTRNRGQITAGVLAIIGLLFSTAIGVSWKAFDTASKAEETITEVKIQMAEIANDIKWIKSTMEKQNQTLKAQVSSSSKNL